MKKSIIFSMVFLCIVLSGCSKLKLPSGSTEDETFEYPVGALLPVMDEAKEITSTKIELTDFTLKLPDGYVYTKVERTMESDNGNSIPYNLYYVWQKKSDNEYILDYDGDTLLYIFEGVDTNSPHKSISSAQAKQSISLYASILTSAVSSTIPVFDTEPVITSDKKNYAISFYTNSGNYTTTTYGENLYPKTYYGLYTLNTKNVNASRKFYGFIFSNDTEGEIFKQSEYENLFSQIKKAFGITEFYYVKSRVPELQFKTGRTYEDLVKDVIYEQQQPYLLERGLFYNTLLYYVNTTGRDYQRKNVDKNSKPQKTESTPLPDEAVPSTNNPQKTESTPLPDEAVPSTNSDTQKNDTTSSSDVVSSKTTSKNG